MGFKDIGRFLTRESRLREKFGQQKCGPCGTVASTYSSGPSIVPVAAVALVHTGTTAATGTALHTATTGCSHLCQAIS